MYHQRVILQLLTKNPLANCDHKRKICLPHFGDIFCASCSWLHGGWEGGGGGGVKFRKTRLLTSAIFGSEVHTANEGPVRIQYKCLVPIYVFPEIKLQGLVISETEL